MGEIDVELIVVGGVITTWIVRKIDQAVTIVVQPVFALGENDVELIIINRTITTRIVRKIDQAVGIVVNPVAAGRCPGPDRKSSPVIIDSKINAGPKICGADPSCIIGTNQPCDRRSHRGVIRRIDIAGRYGVRSATANISRRQRWQDMFCQRLRGLNCCTFTTKCKIFVRIASLKEPDARAIPELDTINCSSDVNAVRISDLTRAIEYKLGICFIVIFEARTTDIVLVVDEAIAIVVYSVATSSDVARQ